MANLSFFYSSMNGGKSLLLIKSYFDFAKIEDGEYNADNIICFTSSYDNRFGVGKITSRPLKTQLDAIALKKSDNICDIYQLIKKDNSVEIDLILVDEAQFLNHSQVLQICNLVDRHNINVMCFGLRTDFKGNLFEGSSSLLGYADKLREVKNKCSISRCTSKATMNARIDSNGDIVRDGDIIKIGAESIYKSLCRKHFLGGKIE